MKKAFLSIFTAFAIVSLIAIPAQAAAAPQQGATQSQDKSTRVTVSGDATVSAQPDTAILVFSVLTQNKDALEAQQDNATLSTKVIEALKRSAGAGAEIKTSGYTLSPQRVYKEGQPPVITGYEARNSVTVTMGALDKVGAVIDAATSAGANNVDGISFTLRKDQSVRDQALTGATTEAIGKARTIAQALGGRLIRISEVNEAGAQPRPILYAEATAFKRDGASTPVEVGTLELRSQVTVVAEIAIG